jgi:hypothetical protein
MVSREELFRQRALEAGEMAKSAEAMGFKEIAAAYRRAEALWLDMAEQQKRLSA